MQKSLFPNVQALAASQTARPLMHRSWLLAVVLIVATLAVYQSVWRAGFIWDDDHHLTNNPAIISHDGVRMIWSSLRTSRYYPLTLTTFWVQRRLWGLCPLPYHLFNVVLHAINGILVYFALQRLRAPAPWLGALLWAIHPVNVESVAWITELKNTQSGCFFLLAVLCYFRFESSAQWKWYGLSLLCGAAAFLSKPSTVILPLVLLLSIWWRQGFVRRGDWWRMVPFLAMAAGMSVLTIIEQRGQILRLGGTEWKLPLVDRFLVAGRAIWFYAAKLVWPEHLIFVYPRWDLSVQSRWCCAGVLALAVLCLVLWGFRRERWARAGLFGAAFFVIALSPVLGFFDVFYFQYSFVADHFQYLASIGLIALMAGAAATVCAKFGRTGRRFGVVMAVVILATLGILTWRRGWIYHDNETLWRDTLAKNTACWMAYTNLGNLLQESGSNSEAVTLYEQALRIKPDYPTGRNDLAVALLALGRTDEAIRQLNLALRTNPDLIEALDNLAWLLATLSPAQGGNPARSLELAQRSCELTGNCVAASLNTLSMAYASTGRLYEAVIASQRALDVARSTEQTKLIGQIEQVLRSYQARLANQQSPSVGSSSER